MHKTVRDTMSRTERGDKYKTIPANTEFVIGATLKYWESYGGDFVVIASGVYSTRFVKVADIEEIAAPEPDPIPEPGTLAPPDEVACKWVVDGQVIIQEYVKK